MLLKVMVGFAVAGVVFYRRDLGGRRAARRGTGPCGLGSSSPLVAGLYLGCAGRGGVAGPTADGRPQGQVMFKLAGQARWSCPTGLHFLLLILVLVWFLMGRTPVAPAKSAFYAVCG